jgi:hypothetical protein
LRTTLLVENGHNVDQVCAGIASHPIRLRPRSPPPVSACRGGHASRGNSSVLLLRARARSLVPPRLIAPTAAVAVARGLVFGRWFLLACLVSCLCVASYILGKHAVLVDGTGGMTNIP